MREAGTRNSGTGGACASHEAALLFSNSISPDKAWDIIASQSVNRFMFCKTRS